MKTIKKQDKIFIVTLLISFAFLVWKASYGYIYNDEPFLLGLGYRLVNGDAMISNEWSVMSIVSFLIYPFMLIYNIFSSTTDNIIMFGRYSFILIWTLTIIFSYFRLRKFNYYTIIACLIFYLFAPLDMMTLSYNSFALSGLLLFSVLLFTAKNKYDLIFAGIFFAIAVISMPFLIIIYILFTFIFLFCFIFKIKVNINEKFELDKGWFYISIGSFIMLIIFLLFIFSRISLQDFIGNLKYFNMTNAEHPIPDFFEFVFAYKNQVFLRFKFFVICSSILTFIIIIDRNRKKRTFYYLVLALIILIYQYTYLFSVRDIYPRMNLIAVPITLIGVISFFLTEKRNIYLFIHFIILSILYSIIINLSSNLGIMAISSMFIISGFGSILLLRDLMLEVKEDNHIHQKLINIITICFIILQLSNQIYYRYVYYYMDKKIDLLVVKLDEGPGNGTIVHQERANNYYLQYNQIKELTFDIENDDQFVYLEHVPWVFLVNNTKWATYSTWGYWIDGKPNIEKTLEINLMYYNENPEKFPTYVLLLKEDKEKVAEFLETLDNKDYKIRESSDFILYYK